MVFRRLQRWLDKAADDATLDQRQQNQPAAKSFGDTYARMVGLQVGLFAAPAVDRLVAALRSVARKAYDDADIELIEVALQNFHDEMHVEVARAHGKIRKNLAEFEADAAFFGFTEACSELIERRLGRLLVEGLERGNDYGRGLIYVLEQQRQELFPDAS